MSLRATVKVMITRGTSQVSPRYRISIPMIIDDMCIAWIGSSMCGAAFIAAGK